ncbi:MAG: LytTR family DNA-binding domain-containing protein [Cyclobacteriaceae bacterium]
MNLKDLKLSPFDTRSQAIVFDENGKVKDSDNTLFELPAGSANVYEEIALFQGMEDLVRKLGKGEELKFNCIHINIRGREAHYDFLIKNHSGEFCLLIYDFSEQYQKVFELQQERNLRDIESKKLERENRQIQEENEVINRLFEQMGQSGSSEYVLLRSDHQFVNVDLNTVNYFEAYGDYIKVHTETKMYIIHNRMKNLEEQLPKGKFVRIHRSYIVQADKIKNIEQLSANVAEKILPIGKQYKQELLSQMKQL